MTAANRLDRLDPAPGHMRSSMGNPDADDDGFTPLPTSLLERGLIATAVFLIPFDDRLTIWSLGASWIVFGLLTLLVFLKQPNQVFHVVFHRRLVPLYVFLVLTALIEYAHPLASLFWWTRVAQMAVGVVVFAAACRDAAAVRTALYSFLASALLISIPFTLLVYGPLRGATAVSFAEATQTRTQLFGENIVTINGINTWAGIMGLGCALAVGLSLRVKVTALRAIYLASGAFMLLSTFLSFSRGGALAAVCGSVAALLYQRGQVVSRFLRIILFAAVVIILVPAAVLPRFSVGAIGTDNTPDARQRLLVTTVTLFPEYAALGIGAGNYWGEWGEQNGFAKETRETVGGAHNAFAQVLIQWGLPGLVALLFFLWSVVKMLPARDDPDPMSAALVALVGVLFSRLLISHDLLYGKELSIGLGAVLGYGIWQKHSVSRLHRSSTGAE